MSIVIFISITSVGLIAIIIAIKLGRNLAEVRLNKIAIERDKKLINECEKTQTQLSYVAGELNFVHHGKLYRHLKIALKNGLSEFTVIGGSRILSYNKNISLGTQIHPMFKLFSEFPQKMKFYIIRGDNRTRLPWHFALGDMHAIAELWHFETDMPKTWVISSESSVQVLKEAKDTILKKYEWIRVADKSKNAESLDIMIKKGKLPCYYSQYPEILDEIEIDGLFITKKMLEKEKKYGTKKAQKKQIASFNKRVGTFRNYKPYTSKPIILEIK